MTPDEHPSETARDGAEAPVVMLSSTARDLPAHREQAREACLEAGFFPRMMEHLPASSEDAVRESMEMVEKSQVYVGIFAHRYGYVPDGQPEGERKSITRMELERAKELEIPVLVFLSARSCLPVGSRGSQYSISDDLTNGE